jgi:Cft2 family RNA processing exonuclease
MAKLVALGGAIDPEGKRPGIGGSSYLIRSGEWGWMKDFGQYPQSPEELRRISEEASRKEIVHGRPTLGSVRHLFDVGEGTFSNIPSRQHLPAYRVLENLGELGVIISHAHLDHVGPLPFLMRVFPSLVVYMTKETLDIAAWLWGNALHIARKNGDTPLFDERDVRLLQARIRLVAPGISYEDGPFRFQVFPAGHIRGAVSCLVEVRESQARRRAFFTGDICFHDQLTVSGAPRLSGQELGDIDDLVVDATYAGRSALPREETTTRMINDVVSCLEAGGKFLFGSLAIGRSIEIFAILKTAGIVDRYPVYIDGSARAIGIVYSKMGIPGLADLHNHFVRSKEHREQIIAGGPCIMIAPSGMYAHAWSQGYARLWAGDENNVISMTCYQDPCSPGFQMLKAKPGDLIPLGDSLVELRAKVGRYQLSAHMDGDDLNGLVDRLRPKRTFLVHGGKETIDNAIAKSPEPLTKMLLGVEYDL